MTEENKNENLEENQENIKKADEEVKTEDPQNNDKEVEEEPKIVEDLEDAGEDELVEQLSIIKEVRDELANAYKTSKDQQATIEQLGSDLKSTKILKSNNTKTIESLSRELDAYKAREAEAEQTAYIKRLEQLSSDFTALGQSKTVEQLGKLPKVVITEFEAITGAALKQKSEEKLDSVTVPSESMGEKKMEEKKNEKPKSFNFTDVCNTLQKQQTEDGSNSKRTINM